MILWRLTEDCRWLQMLEGSCITEEKYSGVFYTDKALFEPIQDYERKDMIEYSDESYCIIHGIECVLFYNEKELENFLKKI